MQGETERPLFLLRLLDLGAIHATNETFFLAFVLATTHNNTQFRIRTALAILFNRRCRILVPGSESSPFEYNVLLAAAAAAGCSKMLSILSLYKSATRWPLFRVARWGQWSPFWSRCRCRDGFKSEARHTCLVWLFKDSLRL